MASVFLEVGQCGIQLGEALWDEISARLPVEDRHGFCRISGRRRCVVVDTEPKVVRAVVKKDSHLTKANVFSGGSGRGANWAFAYNSAGKGDASGLYPGKSLAEGVVDAVRRESERCDAFSGFIMMHSLCGGTGSGVGSRLVECLRDEFPLAHQLSICVVPSLSGESPMQSYNSMLCLDRLQSCCDGILIFENDHLLKRCLLSTAHHLGRNRLRPEQQGTLPMMNKLTAETIAGLFLPADLPPQPKRPFSVGLEPWDMLRSVCPMPSVKLLHADHVSESHPRSWHDLALEINRHRASCRSSSASAGGISVGDLVKDLQMPGYNLVRSPQQQGLYWLSQTVSFAAAARGMRYEMFLQQQPRLTETLRTGLGCVSWNPFPSDVLASRTAATPGGSSLSVCSNGTAVLPSIAALFVRAKKMLVARAYVHWYERFNCGEDELRESFENVMVILENYSSAVK